jgi:predicted nucleic acid-binding protein
VTAYFDTSVITKWYLPEPDSGAALRTRARFALPVVLTHLHRVELVTAWHLKVFRNEIPRGIVELALGHVEADVVAGLWELPVYDLVDVYSQAESISRQHTAMLGARSLDVLHVAAAIILAASAFITDDDRQARLARAAGLRVTMLPVRGRQR